MLGFEGDSREQPTPPLESVLFRSPLATVGSFRAGPEHPRFSDSGPIENFVFVFPRSAVWIRHRGEQAFVADPTVITFYNRGQVYWRGRISDCGDCCEWFALAPEAVLEAVRCFTPDAEEHPERPFSFSHARSSPWLYLRQRLLVRQLEAGRNPDALRTEETCLELLHGALASAFQPTPVPSRPSTRADRRQRELAHEAASILAKSFREPLTLSALAVQLRVSAGHLCRVFRRHVGTRLHRYRDDLRLRTALEEIARSRDLTDLALELGYSSHSHFTAAFRSSFGKVPSEVRRRMGARSSARSGIR